MAAEPPSASPRANFADLARRSALAAIVAGILTFPLVGLQTRDQGADVLSINTHFLWVAIAVAAAFLGRFALGLWRPRRPRASAVDTAPSAESSTARRNSLIIGAIGFVVALLLPAAAELVWPSGATYLIDLATRVLVYVMLGWGLNVVVGLAGLLDLGYVAFYAVGAYSFALFAQWFDLSFWQALPIAGALAASFGIILGFPVLRLRGDYLAIVTLGFGEIIRIILINWSDVTNGPNGINGIPRPTFFGIPFDNPETVGDDVTTFSQFFNLEFAPVQRYIWLYYIILLLALVTNAFTLRLRKLPIGRAWEALREDEIACRALGLNPRNIKLSAFAIGAMTGGFAGAFFATQQGFISPESFAFIESAIILAIVVLGGMGSQLGVVLAAVVLVLLPQFGQWFAGVPVLEDLGRLRMLLFGMAMVAIMILRPRGLLAHREPSLRLHRRGGAAATRGEPR